MTTIIIEDEKILADKLERFIKEIDDTVTILAKITTVRNAVEWLKNNQVDLIFLDIQLADGLSFDIFEQIQIKTPVIFTTAYDQYAVKAFKNNGIDYLLKPINIKELKESINKFKDLYQYKEIRSLDFNALIDLFKNKPETYKKRFTIQTGSKIKIINCENIAYFYTLEKGVYIKTNDNRDFTVDYSLSKLEDILDPDVFFRVSRKYIISFQSINELITLTKSKLKIRLKPELPEDLIISYKRSGALKKWLDK